MAEESDLEKTEPASPRRLEKAREEGQVARSREWVTFALLGTALAGLWLTAGSVQHGLDTSLRHGLAFDRAAAFDPSRMLALAQSMGSTVLIALAPLLGMLLLAALLAPVMLGGLVFSTKVLLPDFGKLDPVAGLGRMFSAQSLADLVKALAKAALVGAAGWFVLAGSVDAILGLLGEPVRAAVPHTMALVVRSCAWMVAALLLIAALDVPYQLWSLHHKLRMSREDLRQEQKESDGDPHVKGRIRRQQQALARRRMMAEVPKADVVVTNPTHFAVALRYVEGQMGAPRLVAKGSDLVAERIRALAREHRVEVVESPALARSLYRHTDLGKEIPSGLYTAVAELLAWVYQLRAARSDGRAAPALPADLPIPESLRYEVPAS